MSKIDLEDSKSSLSSPNIDNGIYKELNIKSESEIEQDVCSSIFIPKYVKKPELPDD